MSVESKHKFIRLTLTLALWGRPLQVAVPKLVALHSCRRREIHCDLTLAAWQVWQLTKALGPSLWLSLRCSVWPLILLNSCLA